MAKLKTEVVKEIREDKQLQGAIANATGKSPISVGRWIKERNHEKLTVLSALRAIAKYKGTTIETLIAA